MFWWLWNFDPQRKKTSELNLAISTSLLTVNMKNAEKDSPGEKRQKKKIMLFTSGAVSQQISRLEQLSQERGIGGQMRGVQRFLLMRGSGVARFPLSQIKPSFQGEQGPKFSKQRKVIPIKVVIEKILAKVKKGWKSPNLEANNSCCQYFRHKSLHISYEQLRFNINRAVWYSFPCTLGFVFLLDFPI